MYPAVIVFTLLAGVPAPDLPSVRSQVTVTARIISGARIRQPDDNTKTSQPTLPPGTSKGEKSDENGVTLRLVEFH